ncbi:uncharacterized protein TNCV_4112601 [Trichonephila clavipes]|nr:uncharacterized protein TNCV_4112601 [Trichonephila clavipes]
MRMVQSFLSVGKGYLAMEKFCMLINMALPSIRTFNTYKKKLCKSLVRSTEKSLNDVRSQVKSANQSNSAITDIYVTCDGTWLTRGYSSQIGVGCVIDLLTGFVMDFEIMSKRCIECEHAKSGLGENSAEFHVWYEGHISSCAINHVRSSCAMEQEAAHKLWQRSEDNGFRYATPLSHGDAKRYQYLKNKEVYGPEIKIKKEECINHVSKRLGTSLRKAVKEWRARGVSLGGKFRGSLKEETIKKLSRYYQNAIRSNKCDVEARKTAMYATLFHNISTPKIFNILNVQLEKILGTFYRLLLLVLKYRILT